MPRHEDVRINLRFHRDAFALTMPNLNPEVAQRTDSSADYVVAPTVEAASPHALTDEWMHATAERLGLDVLPAHDRVLQLDVDSDEAYARALAGLKLLKSLGEQHDVVKFTDGEHQVFPSKSGGEKRHILVPLSRPLGVLERILLQACLGSDPGRELMSWAGVKAGKQEPVVLFRPRPAVPVVALPSVPEEETWTYAPALEPARPFLSRNEFRAAVNRISEELFRRGPQVMITGIGST